MASLTSATVLTPIETVVKNLNEREGNKPDTYQREFKFVTIKLDPQEYFALKAKAHVENLNIADFTTNVIKDVLANKLTVNTEMVTEHDCLPPDCSLLHHLEHAASKQRVSVEEIVTALAREVLGQPWTLYENEKPEIDTFVKVVLTVTHEILYVTFQIDNHGNPRWILNDQEIKLIHPPYRWCYVPAFA